MEVPERPDLSPPDDLDTSHTRAQLVHRAATSWQGQLVDLGGRNTLLYYKDLRVGTLDIGPGTGADDLVVASLLGAKTVRLSHLFPSPEQQPVAAKAARTITAKAREMFEERGLRTLYVGWGMATWTNSRGTATPAAPILMAPIALTDRGSAGEDFNLSLTDDFEVNPTFLHMLSTDFRVDIDGEELLDLLGDDAVGAPDPTPVFDRLTKACAELPAFAVSPRVVIGNFSYAKLSMVKDLEGALEELVAHDLIAAIAGDQPAQRTVRDRHVTVSLEDPNFIPLKDEFLVLDADASQNFAINAVIGEKDLVIDGPPGTGKSQTISNLIGSLVARGKKVLFVAEKRAAIDAVLDRLEKVGLGDLVLDLHDGVGNRRRLAEELARALQTAASIPAPNLSALPAQEQRRQALLDHDAALHEPRGPWDMSVFDAQSIVLGTSPYLRTDLRLSAGEVFHLDAQAARAAKAALEEFVELDGAALLAGSLRSEWASALTLGSISTPDRAMQASELIRRSSTDEIPALIRDLNAGAQRVGIVPAGSFAAWDLVTRLWSRIEVTSRSFSPEIHGQDLHRLVSEMAPASRSIVGRAWATIFNGPYRRATKTVRSLALEKKPTPDLLRLLVDAANETSEWLAIRAGNSRPASPEEQDSLSQRLAQVESELDLLTSWIGVEDVRSRTAGEVLDLLGELQEQHDVLLNLPRLTTLHTQLLATGLLPLVREVGGRGLTSTDSAAVFDHVWASSVLDAVAFNDPRIATFQRERHDRVAREFTAGDHSHLNATPRRILRAVAETAIKVRSDHPEQEQVVVKQAKLRRKHLPARDLFQAAPDVLTAMKPCWAMSPLVVSQLLPPQAGLFDVVIFDEASQIRPADAVGSLLRGKRAVVAGDPHQLPPTAFFLASEDEDDDDETSLTVNMESILDAMSVLLPPPIGTRTLSWHYRSNDERLITFSNAQPTLYDWSLTTFPGVTKDGCLQHVLVPFEGGGIGQEESSGREVETVVQMILEHAERRPQESLGVIAMGIKHADRVSEALRRARATHPDLDAFFDEGAKEPFFVKNLERVQGDERDAIILTIGYGKTSDGRLLYRFGPIMMQGGERRLNVAITRARSRMTAVSSFSASEMDPSRLRSEGAKMLRRYLQYAESGGSDLGHLARQKPPMNQFERDVLTALTGAGIPLTPQLGSAGYWIDFAASHPTKPGQMVLAIEADGAMYHSTPTARERDRLRQEHLERLGWMFHRIWSTSWFRDRDGEIALAKDAYGRAVRRADGDGDDPERSDAPVLIPPGSPSRGPRPPVPRGLSIVDYSQRQLVAIVRWIQSDTLLRTKDELLDAVMDDLGFERRGSRIVDVISAAIDEATL